MLLTISICASFPLVIYQNVTAQPQYLTYENPNYGIRIQYPSNWNKAEIIADDPTVTRAAIFEFMAPENNPSRLSSFVTVAVSVLPNNMTLDEYMRRVDGLIGLFGTAVNIESHSGTLAGLPAIERSFTLLGDELRIFRPGLSNFKVNQIIASANDQVYVVTYFSPEMVFQRDLPIAQNMINSLEITR
jgi:eukaryotic-like serine/threonine-protein kinase